MKFLSAPGRVTASIFQSERAKLSPHQVTKHAQGLLIKEFGGLSYRFAGVKPALTNFGRNADILKVMKPHLPRTKKRSASHCIQVAAKFLTALLLALAFTWSYELYFADWLETTVEDAWASLRGTSKPAGDIVIVSIDQKSRKHFNVALKTSDIPSYALYYDDIEIDTLKSFVRKMHEAKARSVGVFPGPIPHGGAILYGADSGALDVDLPLKINIALDHGSLAPKQSTFYTYSYLALPPWRAFSRFTSGDPETWIFDLEKTTGPTARLFYGAPGASIYKAKLPFFPDVILGQQYKDAPDDNDLVHYYGPSGTFPTVTLLRALTDASLVESGFFRDKIVLLGRGQGYDPNFFGEKYRTPLWGEALDPIEIVATQISNLIDNSWTARLSVKTERSLMFVLSLAAFASFLFLDTALVVLCLIGLFLVWAVVSFAAFLFGFFIPGLSFFLIPGVGGFLIGAYREDFKKSPKESQKSNQGVGITLSPSLEALSSNTNEACSYFGIDTILSRDFYESLCEEADCVYLGCISFHKNSFSQEGKELFTKVQNLAPGVRAQWKQATSLYYARDFICALELFLLVGNADCGLSQAAWRYVEDIARRCPELSIEIPADWSEKMASCEKGIRLFIPLNEHQLSDRGPCQNVPPWEH